MGDSSQNQILPAGSSPATSPGPFLIVLARGVWSLEDSETAGLPTRGPSSGQPALVGVSPSGIGSLL